MSKNNNTTPPGLEAHLNSTTLFTTLNQTGINVSNVPAGFNGQDVTFQRARFAFSVPETLLQRPPQAVIDSVLNHPQVHPVYRPHLNLTGAGGAHHNLGGGFMPLHSNMPGTTYSSVFAQGYPRTFHFANPMMPGMPYPGRFPAYSMPPPTMQSPGNLVMAQVHGGMQALPHMGLNPPIPLQSHVMQVPALSKRRFSHAPLTSSGAAAVENDSTAAAAAATSSSGARRKRRKRDPALPKPARFAWNFYFQEQYGKIRKSDSELNNVQKAFTEIGLDLGKKWKLLSLHEKEPYLKLAAADRQRYEQEYKSRLQNGGASQPAGRVTRQDYVRASAEDVEEEVDDNAVLPSSAEGEFEEIDPDGRVGIVLHHVQVEDSRTEAEKVSNDSPSGELLADVLIVDDDTVFLKILTHKLVLGRPPLKVVTVTDAEDARRMIVEEKKQFGVMLIDMDFGEGYMDGISSLKLIRESGYRGAVAGVTGSKDKETLTEFKEQGANDSFSKDSTDFYDSILRFVTLHSENVQEMESRELSIANSPVSGSVLGIDATARPTVE